MDRMLVWNSIIWYPIDEYRCNYTLKDQDINQAFAILKNKKGFRNYKEEVYPTYSRHLNYLIAWGHATR